MANLTYTIVDVPLESQPTETIEDSVRVDLITPEREFYGLWGRMPDRNDRKVLNSVVELAKMLGMRPACPGVL